MQTVTRINNRLTELFKSKKNHLLNIYFTAGYPKLDDTLFIIQSLEQAGADIVEIGVPFSDPLADGPVIQRSSEMALDNGMTMKVLFDQLKLLRPQVKLPVVLMGYLNPVLQFGVERYCKKASEAGVDGVILPDLPFDEYNERYKDIFEHYNLSNIFLVTPHTSASRMKDIDENTEGFIYVVSTDSTTGGAKTIFQAAEYFQQIRAAKLRNPCMIGFNINSKESFDFANNFANGAIIGSAFIKAISESKNLREDIQKFVDSIKQ